jgi:hypothetical protein
MLGFQNTVVVEERKESRAVTQAVYLQYVAARVVDANIKARKTTLIYEAGMTF